MDNLKVKLVSVEEGITALGFRRVAAIARKLNPKTGIYFITPGNLYSLFTSLNPARKQKNFTNEDIKAIAKELSKTNLLCLSSMTSSADYVVKIIQAVKKKNPKVYILWGGVHCIIHPDEAIKYADAICTGEGEVPFEIFYNKFASNKPFTKTPSMWFKSGKRLIKNPNRPLNTNEELSNFPHLYYGIDCQVYDQKKVTFRQLNKNDFLNYNGLCYWTIWTLGCPYSCIYCANDSFIKLDSNFRKIRYANVDYIIEEISQNTKVFPFISTIMFNDDNFIALPIDIIREFGQKYKKLINLPFVVTGLHPNLVTKEKMKILAKAGMNRGRMGIQSGSKKMLAFYQRPTPINNIKKSAKILGKLAKKYNMIPPAYDIISDNPISRKQDIIDSLKLLYNLERPYTLTVFSLRIFPKTKLYDYFIKNPVDGVIDLQSSYLETRHTIDNILIYILAIFKPPKPLFLWLLKHVKGYQDEQNTYPRLYWIVKTLYLTSRALSHLKRLDFTTIVGQWGYYLWRIGLIKSRN